MISYRKLSVGKELSRASIGSRHPRAGPISFSSRSSNSIAVNGLCKSGTHGVPLFKRSVVSSHESKRQFHLEQAVGDLRPV